jgi:serine/threonine protein kinase
MRQDKATITWLARHRGTRRFEKNVVLRTLLAEYAKDAGMIAVLSQGARAVQALDDPHIVRALDLGEHEGVPFVVFELVDGELVEALLGHPSGPPPLDVALSVADDVCAALERAHDSGLVHGCVSPGNVVITASGVSKVSGFGAAQVRAQDPSGRLARALGEDGRFAAPELALGARLEMRTDVWGLGTLLHAMIVGTPPNPGPALPPALPAVIQDLVMRSIATRPEDRFPSVRDLRRALRASAKDSGVELSHPRVAGIVGERLGANAVARRAAFDRAVVEAVRREEARTLLATPPPPDARRGSVPPRSPAAWMPPHTDTLKPPPADSAAIPPVTTADRQPITPLRPPPDTVRMESMRPDAFEESSPTTRRFGTTSPPAPQAPRPAASMSPAPKGRTLPPPNNNTPVPPPRPKTSAPPRPGSMGPSVGAAVPAGALSPMPFPATSPSPKMPTLPPELPTVIVAGDETVTKLAKPALPPMAPVDEPTLVKGAITPPSSPRQTAPPVTTPLGPANRQGLDAPPVLRLEPMPSHEAGAGPGSPRQSAAPSPSAMPAAPPLVPTEAANGTPPPPGPAPAPGLSNAPAYGPLPPLARPPSSSRPLMAPRPVDPDATFQLRGSSPPLAEVLEPRASSFARSPAVSFGLLGFAAMAVIAMVLFIRSQRTSSHPASHASAQKREPVPTMTAEPPVATATKNAPATTATATAEPAIVATAVPVEASSTAKLADTPPSTTAAVALTAEDPAAPRAPPHKRKKKDAGASSTSTASPRGGGQDDTPGF